ncbi:hypothetical protein KCP75_10855 [Salmonella enterica subsp. enterica]|nr:hypothetical protein KCP75_10855 [Salmonella enterica subsp. enterica]
MSLAEYKLKPRHYSLTQTGSINPLSVKTEQHVATSNAPPASPWHSAGLVSRC